MGKSTAVVSDESSVVEQAEATEVARTLESVLTESLRELKSTVVFEVADKTYGDGSSFSATRQFTYDKDVDDEEWLTKLRTAADAVKASVWEQMRKEFKRDEDGILVLFEQDVMKAMPGTVRVAEGGDPVPQAPAAPPHSDDEVKAATGVVQKAMYKENSEWAMIRYASHPQEFKDNRAGKASGEVPERAPDYSHKKFWKSGFYDHKDR